MFQSIKHQKASSQPLPSKIKKNAEANSGVDLSSVRIQYDPSIKEKGIDAYAQGNRIVQAKENEQVTYHELYHILHNQTYPSVQKTKSFAWRRNEQEEQEAERFSHLCFHHNAKQKNLIPLAIKDKETLQFRLFIKNIKNVVDKGELKDDKQEKAVGSKRFTPIDSKNYIEVVDHPNLDHLIFGFLNHLGLNPCQHSIMATIYSAIKAKLLKMIHKYVTSENPEVDVANKKELVKIGQLFEVSYYFENLIEFYDYLKCYISKSVLPVQSRKPLKVNVLNVGAGDCLVLTLPNKYLIIDLGRDLTKLLNYLSLRKNKHGPLPGSRGIHLKEDYTLVVCTHGDSDHVGFKKNKDKNFSKFQEYLGYKVIVGYYQYLTQRENDTKMFKKLKAFLEDGDLHIYTSDSMPDSSSEPGKTRNRDSLIITRWNKQEIIILAGDQEPMTTDFGLIPQLNHLQQRMSAGTITKATRLFYKVSHHGSRENTTHDVLRGLEPIASKFDFVISSGNRFNHPNCLIYGDGNKLYEQGTVIRYAGMMDIQLYYTANLDEPDFSCIVYRSDGNTTSMYSKTYTKSSGIQLLGYTTSSTQLNALAMHHLFYHEPIVKHIKQIIHAGHFRYLFETLKINFFDKSKKTQQLSILTQCTGKELISLFLAMPCELYKNILELFIDEESCFHCIVPFFQVCNHENQSKILKFLAEQKTLLMFSKFLSIVDFQTLHKTLTVSPLRMDQQIFLAGCHNQAFVQHTDLSILENIEIVLENMISKEQFSSIAFLYLKMSDKSEMIRWIQNLLVKDTLCFLKIMYTLENGARITANIISQIREKQTEICSQIFKFYDIEFVNDIFLFLLNMPICTVKDSESIYIEFVKAYKAFINILIEKVYEGKADWKVLLNSLNQLSLREHFKMLINESAKLKELCISHLEDIGYIAAMSVEPLYIQSYENFDFLTHMNPDGLGLIDERTRECLGFSLMKIIDKKEFVEKILFIKPYIPLLKRELLVYFETKQLSIAILEYISTNKSYAKEFLDVYVSLYKNDKQACLKLKTHVFKSNNLKLIRYFMSVSENSLVEFMLELDECEKLKVLSQIKFTENTISHLCKNKALREFFSSHKKELPLYYLISGIYEQFNPDSVGEDIISEFIKICESAAITVDEIAYVLNSLNFLNVNIKFMFLQLCKINIDADYLYILLKDKTGLTPILIDIMNERRITITDCIEFFLPYYKEPIVWDYLVDHIQEITLPMFLNFLKIVKQDDLENFLKLFNDSEYKAYVKRIWEYVNN